jgi:hypothetical protein
MWSSRKDVKCQQYTFVIRMIKKPAHLQQRKLLMAWNCYC